MIPGTTADWADDRDMYRKRIRELEDQNDALAAELDQLKTALATDVLSAFMRNRELEAALRKAIQCNTSAEWRAWVLEQRSAPETEGKHDGP